MAIKQREVYFLPHPINPASVENHPFIVLSTQSSNEHERTFIGVMITSSINKKDNFSFNLTDEMFEHPLKKSGSHVRMHLITLCLNEEAISRVNVMKEFYFKQLMKSIGDLIFDYDFSPL